MQLPVLAVKRFDDQFPGLRIEAADVDVVSVGIGPGDVERFYAAGFAEFVLSDSCVERVGRQLALAFEQLELRPWDDQVQKAGFGADRAVAIPALDFLRRFDFELHRSAVTTAAIDHDIPCYAAFPSAMNCSCARCA